MEKKQVYVCENCNARLPTEHYDKGVYTECPNCNSYSMGLCDVFVIEV